MFIGYGLEIGRAEQHPAQPPPVRPPDDLLMVKPGRADQLKWFCRPASLADGGHAFKQAHARIKQIGHCPRKAGRGQHIRQIGIIIVHIARPARHRHNVQITADPIFSVDVAAKLAHSQPCARRQAIIAHNGVHAGRADGPFRIHPVDGVQAIQHHQGTPGLRAGLHHRAGARQIFIIARPRLPRVKHNDVDIRQHPGGGRQSITVEYAVDGQPRHTVGILGDTFTVDVLATDAVNHVIQRGHIISLVQYIRRGPHHAVYRRPAGRQADARASQDGSIHQIRPVDPVEYFMRLHQLFSLEHFSLKKSGAAYQHPCNAL